MGMIRIVAMIAMASALLFLLLVLKLAWAQPRQ